MSCVEALGEVADRGVAEEDREHGAGRLDDVRDARGREVLGDGGADRQRGGVELGVDLGGGQAQRREAGGGGDRVPRQRAGLVDAALGREVGHQVRAAAERRGGEAAAHHLAEGHQVGRPALDRAVEAPAALLGGAEAGHHLVADEQRAVGAAGLGEEGVEARLGRDDAHVAREGLGDQAGDPRRRAPRTPPARRRGRCRAGRGSRPPSSRAPRWCRAPRASRRRSRPRPAAGRRGRGSSRRTSRRGRDR